jgi:hypothetical protein
LNHLKNRINPVKKIKLILSAIFIFLIGCEDKKAEENIVIDESVKEFISVNIKVSGPEYFTFSENKGITTEPSMWDLSFAIVDYQPSPQAPVIKDPVIIIGNGKTAAKVEANSLTDVITLPAASLFKGDNDGFYTTQGWYDYNPTNHIITPKEFVYIVKIDETKNALIEIVDYYNENGDSGYITIHWKFLTNKI